MVLQRFTIWLAAAWLFSLVTVAGMVPLLFRHAPTPAIAGNLAAHLFSAETAVAAVCAVCLLLLIQANKAVELMDKAGLATLFIVAGLLANLLGELAVAPRIVARDNLALWHSVGSGLYLLHALCALGVWCLCARKAHSTQASQ